MPIDPLGGDILTFADAARRLPPLRSGRPVNPATLWRWPSRGLAGVRLEIVRVGGTACTSEAALRAFFAAVDESKKKSNATTPVGQAAETNASRAAAELDDLGI